MTCDRAAGCDHARRDPERLPAGLQRDGPRLRAVGVQPGDHRRPGPLRRDLPPRHRRADRAGRFGLPIFVGTMQETTTGRDRRAPRRSEPGDIFIVNDPYLGGTHLMDVKFVKPFFYQGRLFAWLANTGHWPDIGGSVPGGYSASATEVEQEGLRLPPVKLFKRGETRPGDPVDHPLEHPRRRTSASATSRRRRRRWRSASGGLTELIDRYGDDVVEAAIAELRARATRQMRAKIAHDPGRRSTRARPSSTPTAS